ncbi:hypothetical protein HA402_007042 [Bradysia odoriphaga]|nr:hypothetical protein HA402_007042 [Bradysia odoriphaga]
MRMEESNHTASTISRSNSRTSSNSELEREIADLDINALKNNSIKKRVSSSRTPTRKAKRVRFYRNGDRFYSGIVIAVSNERYRSFESLTEDLTRILEDRVPAAVRHIYTISGKKITTLDEIVDGTNYVCLCNNETFKKIEYNSTPLANVKSNNRLSKVFRPSSPLKNGINGSPIIKYSENSVVHPRIVTLIRNGTKPRKIHRLLLNKRNSPSFDHVLTAITQCVKLDTGCVRKVYSLCGTPVLSLEEFFGQDEVFFAYGNERVGQDDFKLEPEESKAVQQTRKTLRNGTASNGPKPKMPVKNSVNLHNVTYELDEKFLESGIDPADVPEYILNNYVLGEVIGNGNFAAVLKMKDKATNKDFALKIIDKSMCKGKEHYIDAEVRVMKKLNHPHIMSLYKDIDTVNNMYLILEYVSGGDLFDVITKLTRFSEAQARIMIRHLASAMAYIHSLGIVHRDVKPENLLVEMGPNGTFTELKLADFGLACEVVEPLFAVCGTPTYVAPEILMETGYGLKIDVWAAGIILYIMLCGFPPFVSYDNQQEPLFDAILSGVYEFPEPYWNDIGEGVRDLISNMLQSDPNLRFSAEDVLDHPWTIIDEECFAESSQIL